MKRKKRTETAISKIKGKQLNNNKDTERGRRPLKPEQAK